MRLEQELSIIGDPAHVPEQPYRLLAAGPTQAVIGPCSALAPALAASALKLDQLGTIIFAAAGLLFRPVAEAVASRDASADGAPVSARVVVTFAPAASSNARRRRATSRVASVGRSPDACTGSRRAARRAGT